MTNSYRDKIGKNKVGGRRKGRSSHKDKYKSKQERMRDY